MDPKKEAKKETKKDPNDYKKDMTPEEKKEQRKKAAELKKKEKEQRKLKTELRKKAEAEKQNDTENKEKKSKKNKEKTETKTKKDNKLTVEDIDRQRTNSSIFEEISNLHGKIKEIFTFTSYEERKKELEENKRFDYFETTKKTISSKDIIDMLYEGNPAYDFVNEELIHCLTYIVNNGINKQTKSSMELLEAFVIFVKKVDGENYIVLNKIKSIIDRINKIIEKFLTYKN